MRAYFLFLLERIKNDTTYRIKLFLRASFIFNILYSAFLFTVGKIFSSKWFFVMSVYYGLLSIARIFTFLQIKGDKPLCSKIKAMRITGVFLLLINSVVSVMMLILIYTEPIIRHHEITVIAIAAYAFTSLSIAIVNCVKYIRKNDYLFSSVKIISLVSASVSMVTLTNTMLATWGQDEILLRIITLPLLSLAVSVFIIFSALTMIRKANKDLRMLENEEE